VDNGEVIAIDIPYSAYAAQQAFYREAFIASIASVRGVLLYSVYITNYQISSQGTTLLYFDTIFEGTDYDVAAAASAVQTLFDTGNAACATTTPIGCPAHTPLLAAFAANGLPAPAAYYNDQLVASLYGAAASGVNASQIGTWQSIDSGEVIVLNVAFGAYAARQQSYKEAFTAAVAQVLNVSAVSVYVNDFQQSTSGTTKIYFDIELPATTSSVAVPAEFAEVASLFTPCHGPGNSPVGCPALPPLVLALQQYGLPVTNAYYNDE